MVKVSMEKKLKELLEQVKSIKWNEGFNETLIPGLKVIKTTKTNDKTPSIQRPSICLVLQGVKKVIVGDQVLSYAPGEFIVASIEVPVTGLVTDASAQKPYLCLMLEVDPSIVFDVLQELPTSKVSNFKERSGVYVGSANSEIYDAFFRLVKAMDVTLELKFMVPMIVREIIFRLLEGDKGIILRQMGMAGSHMQKITMAIELIKQEYNRHLSIEQLAHEVGMSPSSFHKNFKDITRISPLQYQKLLRLQEARRLLLANRGDAASVSFEVGYESPSQFSREYSKLFGKPPKRDMERLKA